MESPLISPTQPTASLCESGSFRDRHARVYVSGGRIFRGLSRYGWKQWELLAGQAFTREFVERGNLVATQVIERELLPAELAASDWEGFVEHDPIPVVSYPYEWCFSMLRDAALLHLDLLEAALRADMTMKDGSAYNVQWRGAKPVFIDIASFEELPPQTPWTGYRQFCQLFLFPLMLQAYRGFPFHAWLRGRIDGIEVADFWKLLSTRELLRKGVFTHVFLHAKLQRAYATTTRNLQAEISKSGFHKEMILANVAGLRRTVQALSCAQSESNWTSYASDNSYNDPDRTAKEQFVQRVLSERHWPTVWDLGCNTGKFARMAAEHADYVLAMDADHACIDRLYRELRSEGPGNILPLFWNVVDPSPGMGWRLDERKSLTKRSQPNLTLCLALIHHLVIGANVPLRELIDWLASLGSDLLIEFVDKRDPMVQTLLRNKADIYDDYDAGPFDTWLNEAFDVVASESLTSGTRTLYYAKARN